LVHLQGKLGDGFASLALKGAEILEVSAPARIDLTPCGCEPRGVVVGVEQLDLDRLGVRPLG
jgi:hypothetical protein